MEKLLEIAKKVALKAEVYSMESTTNSVGLEDGRLNDIESKFQSGISLRIIKDNKLGFAYTRNLTNREECLENALVSLKGEVEANYDFPITKEIPKIDTYNPSLENLSTTEMTEECFRVYEALKSKINSEIDISAGTSTKETRIINSNGTDISSKTTSYEIYGSAKYSGAGTGIWRYLCSKKFEQMPSEIVNEIIELYKLSLNVVEPQGGKMKVMFMPNSMHTLIRRILSGTNSKNVYEKVSPIANKVGEKIFSEKITIYDDSLNDKYPGARAFDDEGVRCNPLTIIGNGVLKSFYYDLNYAKKLNTTSTGHGYKWDISSKPAPSFAYMVITPGDKSFSELIKSIDKGIIIESVLGSHSGNISNGDYSVGINPGLYVENGEIRGRVKDAMVAGNIYETLKNVIEVGNTLDFSHGGRTRVPPILCDNVSVAIKKR
ncbi:MAG: TldD/PmbA family protein [Candidatus Stahlbacteria bacterium]|nr:TldD/PmbA family protein [Candidatus Stahlbacteria bacterium]